MMRPIVQIALLIIIGTSTGAFAQSQPNPRPPLGPGDTTRQFPAGVQRQTGSVGSDSITVSNLGNATLRFSSWDGASNWKSVQLTPGQSVTISCTQCEGEIPIAFHDGAQNQTRTAKTAGNYGLFWDQLQSRWDFAPISVINRNKGLSP